MKKKVALLVLPVLNYWHSGLWPGYGEKASNLRAQHQHILLGKNANSLALEARGKEG